MKRYVRLDYETASEIDLKAVGLDVYSSHETTRVLMVAYQINGGPIRHVENGGDPLLKEDLPEELVACLEDPETDKIAFNAQFERVITRRVLKIKTPYKGWKCTMVRGFGAGFTGNLGEMGSQMGLPQDKLKDKRGTELIRLFSMPQRITKKNPHRWATASTHPTEWREFCAYNAQDLVAEGAMWDWLEPLHFPEVEWLNYEIDQRINDRGLPVDLELCEAALAMYGRFVARIHARMIEITGVSNPNSPTQLLAWLKGQGYWFNDLRGETVEKVLRENAERWENEGAGLTEEGVELLQLRERSSYTSIKKYRAIIESSMNARVRNTFQFGGAARTFRDSGRGVQTQNLQRPPKYLEKEYTVEACVEAVIAGDDEWFEVLCDNPTEALAGLIRSAFSAPPGKEFRVCDLSSIESCGLGWMSDCTRLQAVFAAGKDPYKDFGTVFYKKPYEEITKPERNICKPPTLGCGYRLGGGDLYDGKKTGLWGYAENMGVHITREDSHKAVKLWRETYPEVPKLWKDYEEAVRRTMDTGRPVRVRMLVFQKVEHRGSYFLRVRLPSGRCLWYHKPQMQKRKVKTGRMKTVMVDGVKREVEDTFESIAFTYMGQEQKTRQWLRLENHGGRWVEQCLAGDTRVLTSNGVKALVNVGSHDLLWDGVAWVTHGGLVFKGERETIEFGGIRLTCDHRVDVDGAWVQAGDTDDVRAASSFARHYRVPFTFHDSDEACERRVAGSENVRCAERKEQVFDLLNAGPLHRFTVVFPDGRMMLVHNCTQALCRDVLWVGIRRCHKDGFTVVGRVHDEIIALESCDDNSHTVERMRELMTAPKDWWQGMHLNAAGWFGKRYRKD